MRYLIIAVLLLSGCATKYYPPMSADRGNQVKYKYSFKMIKCDFCHNDTYIYKIVNGKKLMCDRCYRKQYNKVNGF